MSHVANEWVMWHMRGECIYQVSMNGSWHKNKFHIEMSHVANEWVMSHMDASCHTWMRHVTYACVMSHMNQSRRTWITGKWVMWHMHESCDTCMSHVTHAWVMNKDAYMTVWMRNESCLMSRISHMNESIHTCMNKDACINGSCHAWRSHVTRTNKSGHRVTHSYVTWLIHIHLNHLHPVWMSHVTREWVMSRMKELMVYRAHLKAHEEYVLANRARLMESRTVLLWGALQLYFDDG